MSRAAGWRPGLLLAALVLWPFIPHMPHDAFNTAITASEYLVPALSLVLLIGLVGQISLGQATLVGMGAFVGATATRNWGVHFPLTLLVGTAAGTLSATVIGLVALRVRGLYLAVATMIFAYVGDQYLFTKPWLVGSQSGTSIPFETIGRRGALPFFDLSNAKLFYYVSLAVALAALYLVANLRDSRIGRAFAAIRGSEVAAASLGIDVVRFKLMGFAVAGALAGLGGSLILVGQRTVAPEQFNFTNSLFILSVAVVGGLRSLGGAVAASLLFAILVGEVFFRVPTLANYLTLISAGLLTVVLLFFRGGLGAVPDKLPVLRSRLDPFLARLAALRRTRAELRLERHESRRKKSRARIVARWLGARMSRGVAPLQAALAALPRPKRVRARRRPAMPVAGPAAAPLDVVALASRIEPEPEASVQPLPLERKAPAPDSTEDIRRRINAVAGAGEVAGRPDSSRRKPILLSASRITVQFGGLTAVNDASLQVGAGEIVGLIGPNGAGKTTLFNSILGLNQPTKGTVHLYDCDVTSWGVHQRAALGVGRTFQVLQLFGDLTVFENLLVATHLQNPIGLFKSLFVSHDALEAEHAARERVTAVLKLMELEHIANEQVASLPFGVLRLIEIARTLVTGARLVCFDEAASGLDSGETERLIEWFRLLRQIGITLLVIEHDVDMVTRLCDFIYVLDQGKIIGQGTPAEIRRDARVIAAYLGTEGEEEAS